MLSHEIEIIRLLHRERMEQLARAARRPPREEEAAEQRAPRRRARYALQLRRLHPRLREDL
ncbi:MAG TPA: hypothetical protein VFO81_07290 [Gaiellaceae bacterium]|nr:hypothetical protein [Gaiellaceae bacterium]